MLTSEHPEPRLVLDVTSTNPTLSVLTQQSWTPQQKEAICRCFIRLINAPLVNPKEKKNDNPISTKATNRSS